MKFRSLQFVVVAFVIIHDFDKINKINFVDIALAEPRLSRL